MGKPSIDSALNREQIFSCHVPLKERYKAFFLNYKSVTTTNWIDGLAKTYGNFVIIHLDSPLPYSFMPLQYLGYQDILEFMNRAGNALKFLGVKKGDRVVLVPGNRIELGLLNLACHKIEAVPIPVNHMYKAQEIRRIVEDSGAEIVITDHEVFEKNIGSREVLPSLRKCLVLEGNPPEGVLSLGDLMNESSPLLEPAKGGRHKDVVQIFYSSGTTGFPKGALLRRLGYLYVIRLALGNGALLGGPRDKSLMVTSLPLAHIMGMTVLYVRLAEATPWYFLNRFDPKRVLELIQEKRSTAFIGVPAMYNMLLSQEFEKYDLTSVSLWVSAADAMPVDMIEKVRKIRPGRGLFPLFVEFYGQVETGGITGVRIIPARGRVKPVLRTPPLIGVKIRVVDDLGNELPLGEVGELEVKSPLAASGYWNSPQASQSAFRDGWLRTGDLAKMRGKKKFEVVGRKSERIKCGGYSIFPQEVEEELLLHSDVAEAAVLGISDPVKGQIPVAALVLEPGSSTDEAQLLQWAKDNIAGFKRPRHIKILAELPRGATEKILKHEIMKLFTGDEEQAL